MNARRQMLRTAAPAIALVVAGAALAKAPQGAAPVVAAEREFAAYAAEHGWVSAFRVYSASDGVVIPDGQIRNARAVFNARKETGSRALKWWPATALIARSGDLGFTTGPYTVDDSGRIQGQYFTVWQRQPDGRWLWIFDGGTGTEEPVAIPRSGTVLEFPAPAARRSTSAAALARVAALEAAHTSAKSLVPFLAAKARILRPERPPATGGAARQDMTLPTADIVYGRAERSVASDAGDLVFTLGAAHWPQPSGTTDTGHYARIWQDTPKGWRIVFDELLPVPPPPPAS